MKKTNKINQEVKEVKEVKEVQEVVEVTTPTTVAEEYKQRLTEAFASDETLVNIPTLSNDLSKVILTPFETYLPKYVQDNKTSKNLLKKALLVNIYLTTFNKSQKAYSELCKNNTKVISPEGIIEWFKVDNSTVIPSVTADFSNEKDVTFINNYELIESTFDELNETVNEYRNNLDLSLQADNMVLHMITSKICKTKLPSFFEYSAKNDDKKGNALINNIVHHSTLILQGLNTWKNAEGKNVSLEKQVKSDVTRFYNEKIKPAVIEGGYTSEIIKNFNGACNTQMFRRVFSIINDGFKINEKGVLVPVYSGKKLGRELADMYISYLQGEFSIDNSK